jgi:hypothetical protein
MQDRISRIRRKFNICKEQDKNAFSKDGVSATNAEVDRNTAAAALQVCTKSSIIVRKNENVHI